MPVKVLEHTADLRLKAQGRSFPATLLELSNFMLNLIFSGSVDCEIYISSSISFSNKDNCVVRFLSDILYYEDSHNLALKIRLISIVENNLKWEGCGEKLKSGKHEMGYVVKGVTYDRLMVDTQNNLIEITLDI